MYRISNFFLPLLLLGSFSVIFGVDTKERSLAGELAFPETTISKSMITRAVQIHFSQNIQKDSKGSSNTLNKENPFIRAKVGDWARHRIVDETIKIKDNPGTIMKQTVVSRNSTSVEVHTQATKGGEDSQTIKSTIDLTKPYDISTMSLGTKNKVKVEKLGTGKEVLTIEGKKYDCDWVSAKITMEYDNKNVILESKIWTNKEVPLNGMVRAEITSTTPKIKTVIQIIEYGSKNSKESSPKK